MLVSFITHKDTPWLTVSILFFGHVTDGMNVVNMLKEMLLLKLPLLEKELWQRNLMQLKCSQTTQQ
jgi:cyclophilin family peptidyl-prolyl cis-trans isomerase